MGKVFLVLVGVFVLGMNSASAAPAYGTKMPKAGQVFWGVQHYEILDRDLNKDHGSMKSRQEHILLSYGVTGWFSLDLKAGAGTITHRSDTGRAVEYDTPAWGGGYGFRVRLFERGRVKAVAGFQHISIHPYTVKGNGEKNRAILDDWQGSCLVSYALRYFTPYTGVRYGTTDYIHYYNNNGDRHLAPGSRRTDLVLGVDIPVNDKVWVNVEGAGGTGEAVAASLNFHF